MINWKDERVREEMNDKAVMVTYDWVGTLVISLTVFALLLTCLFRVVGVEGNSMLPTLKNNDRLLLSVYSNAIQRGDIVVVDRYTKEPLIKRVIATGGDTIAIDYNGNVSLNGRVITENYIQGVTRPKDFPSELTIPSGYLFVMGDNREDSTDSRSREVGLVSRKDVIGVVEFRVWPLRGFGSV